MVIAVRVLVAIRAVKSNLVFDKDSRDFKMQDLEHGHWFGYKESSDVK